VSLRIAYWTSTFEPEMEAIASEVALLRRYFRGSVAWGLSHRRWFLLSRSRGLCLHPRLHLLFRALTRLLEPCFQINHIFGSLADWFYLKGARQRPTVLTLAADEPPVEKALLEPIRCFVAEHPGGRDTLARLGIDAGRVRLVFPPVDLKRFIPAPPPAGPFTVLFASSPEFEDWLDARGVPHLLDAAALLPRVRFRLLWRPWGTSEPHVRRMIAERGLDNVELMVGRCGDMAAQYQNAHVVAVPFGSLERTKPAPNSLVEGLACGRPALVTPVVGLSDLVREGQAGVVCEPSAAALADGIERLRLDWYRYANQARRLAERWFGREQFLAAYAGIYQELLR
jgi:glycosyltransferase involved in cell wall biosynthesis